MRKMGIGLGVGINRSNYAQGIFNAYSARVVADGGVVESGSCVDAVSSLLQSASLLLIPSGYKGGKLYAEIPTNGNGDLTWTRGGDAFRTNASGVIQRVPWNLLQYSEAFDNAVWQKNAASITANNTNAPNSTLTADKLIEDSALTSHYVRQAIAIVGVPQTVSIYAKADTRTQIALQLGADLGVYNLSNGTVISGAGASITNVGDGWYRCIFTGTPTNANCIFYIASSGSTSYQGNGTSGIFIWGAQLVEGTTAQTYLPTTDRLNFPRLSYMYGSCPSALLEPQRTNLVVNSGWTGGGTTPTGWISFITGTTTAVASIKNSSVTAYRFSTTSQRAFFAQTISTTIGLSYTLTFYCESVSGTQIIQETLDSVGTFISYYKNGVSISGTTNIEAGNFYSMSVTAINTTTDIRIGSGVRGNQTVTTVLSMPQFEQGAYATTFILTPTSATATRVADSFSRSNIYTNGLISASGGTWFVELRNNVIYTRDGFAEGLRIADVSAGTGNSLEIRNSAGTARLTILKRILGAATAIFETATTTVKIAIKWNGTTADVFVNGTKQVSSTPFTPTNMEFLACNAGDVPKFIQQMALYPTPISDTDCATLTTL